MGRSLGELTTRFRMGPERLLVLAVLALVTGYVLWEVHLLLLLRDTTPVGSELASHLHEPAHLRDNLIPDGRLTGWSQDWFAGYPSGTFYFPVGSILIVLVDLVLPYNVAFKLVSASGMIILPACAYAFGRLLDQERRTSLCLAVGTLPFLLLPTTIVGGSITSTAGSEYAFQLSIAISLLAVGFAGRGLRTGGHRAATAAILGLAALTHILPATMAAVGIITLTLMQPARARLKWTATTFAATGALVGFWLVPWILETRFTSGSEFPKVAAAPYLLFAPFAPILILGLPALIIGGARFLDRRDVFGALLGIMAVLSAIAFVALPSGRIWNGRMVPFYWLWMCLLGGFGVARLTASIDEERRDRRTGGAANSPYFARTIAPFAMLVVVMLLWDSPIAKGATTLKRSDVSDFAGDIYGGLGLSDSKAEFTSFIDTMRRVGREHGCGRAHWEFDKGPWTDSRFGLATLLPYWTDGCIGALHGLYTQSSATFPYVALADGHLAKQSALALDDGPDLSLDVAAGIEDLRVLGTRYYLASSAEAQAEAAVTPGITMVAETLEVEDRNWQVFKIDDDVPLVEPLENTPVVLRGADSSATSWDRAAKKWFHRDDRTTLAAGDGPSAWPRMRSLPEELPETSASTTEVANVRVKHDRISFRVSRVGTPVVVKVSYFPNWRAKGANGPWRVTPNFMVVVPTDNDVSLEYGRTTVEIAGWVLTLLGLVVLGLLWRAAPVAMPEPAPVEEEVVVPKRPGQAKRKPQRKRKPQKKRR